MWMKIIWKNSLSRLTKTSTCRAPLAVAWDLLKSDLPDPAKKATMLEFDKVLGLSLVEWEPKEVDVPRRGAGDGGSPPGCPQDQKLGRGRCFERQDHRGRFYG